MACVYKHIRLDTRNVFYIGIGGKRSRAYDFRARNKYWKHIFNKTDIDVEIAVDNVSYEEAKSWEIYLIGLYGRKDLGNGILVNMTDGGNGANKSRESIEKQLETAKRNGTYQAMVDRISKVARDNVKFGIDHPCSKPVFLYDFNLVYAKKFDTMTSCAEDIGGCVTHICKYMNGGGTVKGFYVFDHMASPTELLSVKKSNFIPMVIYSEDGSSLSFKTMAEAARWLGTDKGYIHKLVKAGIGVYKNFKIEANGKYKV